MTRDEHRWVNRVKLGFEVAQQPGGNARPCAANRAG